MVTLSESNYSLALDLPSSQQQEPILPRNEHQRSNFISIPEEATNIILYQRNFSSKNEQERPNQGRVGDLEVDMYTSDFHLGMFLRSLIISFLFASGIGIPILLLLESCCSKFYRNYLVYTDSETLRNIGYVNLLFIAFTYFGFMFDSKDHKDHKDQNTGQMFKALLEFFSPAMRYHAMVLWSFIPAAIEAYCHPKLIEILDKRRLRDDSLKMTRFRIDYFWRDQAAIKELVERRKKEGASEEQIKIEKEKLMLELHEHENICAIQTTISRLNINMSLYYISFFEKTPENLLRKLKNKQDLPIIEKGNLLIYTERFAEYDILRAITKFERDIFDYQCFTKPSQYDDKKAYAYTLAIDLLFKKKDKVFFTFILIGIIYSAILFYKGWPLVGPLVWEYKGNNIPFPKRILFIEVVLIFYSLPYLTIIFFIFKAIEIMDSKFCYMEELKEMILTKRTDLNNGGDKSYPTLNILDYKSLEAWMCLRKIFMNFSNEKLQRIVLAVIFVLTIELITLIMAGLVHFEVISIWKEIDFSENLMVVGLQTLIFFTALLVFVYHAAKVNAQFQVHRLIMRENKQVAISLFKNYSDFIGENALQPSTYMYNEGLKFLKREYGENLSAETEKRMKKDYKKLTETYENIFEELNHEETENPIKFLGLPVTYTLVKSLGALLFSSSLPLLKEVFSSLFQKIQPSK